MNERGVIGSVELFGSTDLVRQVVQSDGMRTCRFFPSKRVQLGPRCPQTAVARRTRAVWVNHAKVSRVLLLTQVERSVEGQRDAEPCCASWEYAVGHVDTERGAHEQICSDCSGTVSPNAHEHELNSLTFSIADAHAVPGLVLR